MAQEFTIKSSAIEDKINQLLPSQGGFQPGVDFSASTMVIPVVDLTETAEGSSLRADLQTALSHDTATTFAVNNTTTTVLTTTGYYRIVGSITLRADGTNAEGAIIINDGTTDKIIYSLKNTGNSTNQTIVNPNVDLIVFMSAGDSLKIKANLADTTFIGSLRQIADINGNLTNP